MPNIHTTKVHNKKILEERPPLVLGKCNCNNKNECPLNSKCMASYVLYEAKINSNPRNYTEKLLYKGITACIFKTRYGNHKNHSTTSKYYNESELSKEIWKIKNKGGEFNIKWQIIKQYPT